MPSQDGQETLAGRSPSEPDQGWPTPFNISMDKLDLIVKACYTADADRHPVAASQISAISGTHTRTVIPNLKFLASIGILSPDPAKKTYSLTPSGLDYAKALSNKDLESAGKVLKEILPNTHLSDLLRFIEVNGPTDLTSEKLFRRIMTFARLHEDSRYPSGVSAPFQTGIQCLIDMIQRAGFTSLVGRPKFEPPKLVTSPENFTKKASRSASDNSRSVNNEKNLSVTSQPINIHIHVEIKDAESLKRVLELLNELKGLQ